LERGIKAGSRKEENRHTVNNTSKTRRITKRDTEDTLRLMLEYFTPEDNELEDKNHQKHVRELTDQQPNMPDDCEFKRRDQKSD